MESDRISVKEAAQILGVSQDMIRYMMREKLAHLGWVMPSRTGKGFRYVPYRSLVIKHMEESLGCNRK